MADMYLIGCTTPPVLSGTSLAAQCPIANRRAFLVDSAKLEAANLQLELIPSSIESERIQDMAQLFGLMVLVLVGVWGAKQLLRIFSDDTTKD